MRDGGDERDSDEEFDGLLRRGLADLAQDAPTQFRTAETGRASAKGDSHRRRIRAGVPLVAAAAAAMTAVAGVAVLTSTGGSGGDGGTVGGRGSSACPSTLRVAGRSYVSAGDLLRTPVPAQRVGTALLPGGCTDNIGTGRDGNTAQPRAKPDYSVGAYEVPGVSVVDAVFANGKIWVNSKRTSLPPAVVEAREPQPCSLAEGVAVTGKLANVEPKRPPEVDGDVRAPFAGSLYSTDPALTGDRWRSVLVAFRVPADGQVPGLAGMRELLYGDQLARLVLRCERGQYVANSVQVAGGH